MLLAFSLSTPVGGVADLAELAHLCGGDLDRHVVQAEVLQAGGIGRSDSGWAILFGSCVFPFQN